MQAERTQPYRRDKEGRNAMAEKGIQRSSRRGSIPGVTPIRKDGRVVGYQARTILPSKQMVTKYFSVRSYGAASALALAISERRHQLADSRGDDVKEPQRVRPRPRTNRITRQLKITPLDTDLEAIVAADLVAERGTTLQGVHREDIVNAEGWSVIARQGRTPVRRYFLDASFGGAEASLKAAIEFRDTSCIHTKVRRG